MARGGARPGSGRKKKSEIDLKIEDILKNREQLKNMQPLEFMLHVMRNPDYALTTRMRAAENALPYTSIKPSSKQADMFMDYDGCKETSPIEKYFS